MEVRKTSLWKPKEKRIQERMSGKCKFSVETFLKLTDD